jgi:prepilin-type N-terminal cleavage/methylation domain-containing protein
MMQKGFIQHHLCIFKNLKKLVYSVANGAGFTLIELLIVIAIMGILGTVSIAGFNNFNKAQILQTSASDVATMLNLAKYRAQSQAKLGPRCGDSGYTLVGYRVDISQANGSYLLKAICQNSGITTSDSIGSAKILPKSLSFTSSPTFTFAVLSGKVLAPGQIGISGFGNQKTITIDSLGGVNVQ